MEKGYKIARIEQTETPDMLAQRSKGTPIIIIFVMKKIHAFKCVQASYFYLISANKLQKHEKIIRREVCQVATKGVRYASFQDVVASNPFGPESSYLYAITEKVQRFRS